MSDSTELLSKLMGFIRSKDHSNINNVYNNNPELFSSEVMQALKEGCKNSYQFVIPRQAMASMSPKVKFQHRVAKKYSSKLENAAKRNLEFTLTLTSVSNILKAKKCYFTDLPLTEDTITFDRIDNSKGYIQGNVVACHIEVNSFKANMENPEMVMNLELVSKMVKRWEERIC